jgi:putative membrane protein
MTFKFIPALALAISIFTVPAMAEDAAPKQLSHSQDFIQKAHVGNQFEILSSRLALDKSQDSEIREFAQQMIKDHDLADANMKAALMEAKKNIAIQEPAKTLDPTHQKILDTLKAAPDGNSFDSRYIEAQVNAHNETLALFRGYNESGDNEDLKNFAATTIPTLEMHKQHIDRLAMSEKSGKSN